MADSFHLHVVTPKGAALETEVRSLTISTKQGEITVLPSHCLLLTGVAAGRMVATAEDGSNKTYAVAGGYLEAGADHVNVICDRCKAADEVDTETLPARIADLEKKLADLSADAPERAIAADDLHWLQACADVTAD